MLLLGYDIGSSSIKASIIDAEEGKLLASAVSPATELPINAPETGWAEQNPESWWKHVQGATRQLLQHTAVSAEQIAAIGISYQMHGLVLVDENQEVLRPAIIWCDGRAVEIGQQAYQELGESFCQQHLLNSPGNFTASKLRWVQQNEPEVYKKIHKFMLPGDYIAMKLTGEIKTTFSGLSEGILWDYQRQQVSGEVLDHYQIDEALIPDVVPNFSPQGRLSRQAASYLGLQAGIEVSYRAGDQPNNALSLNVLNPGEAAANAGTSGVIYGVTDQPLYDEHSRVNTFVHVNHSEEKQRYGVLLCVNGTGIQYYWLKNNMLGNGIDYDGMNAQAAQVPVGSEGVMVFPFGNGPERSLQNRDLAAQIKGIQFNRHSQGHLIRAAQEGIAFSLNYGLGIMQQMGLEISTLRVGRANMFLSPVFAEAFTNLTGLPVECYETDGAQGAAIGAGIGGKIFEERDEAFTSLKKDQVIEPDSALQEQYATAYERWEQILQQQINN